ncbi:adenosine deaminase [Fuchsiella alkaliacetigena]|uniref:adenosine deaminase n=1 Tax=Fuchsiella alkaliacetigena TaxID=957042 RepID=UPI00200A904E|nr:adenosine deaminase [Fuchsiella alkaliacetigena]MCK8824071.1 adenosine deaminase [Fuchsiella alkaliacetigena]
MKELLRKLPKVELHLHLDGSLRAKTVKELAAEQGIELPAEMIEDLKSHLQVNSNWSSSLEEYLQKFELPVKIMQSKKAISRVAYELVEDVASENVRYLELRFAPLLLTAELSKEEVVETVLAALQRAEEDYGVQSRVILCCMRNQDPAQSTKVAQLALDYLTEGVVALDLAGDEANFPPEEHEQAFCLAKGGGLHRTVHAGEAAGVESVRKAIDFLQAQRIGHGIRAGEDEETLEIIKEKEIALEVCPSSNVHTGVVDSLGEHPIKEYYQEGVPVTVNTDNRTVSNTTLTEEYLKLQQRLDFSLADIKELILNGVKAAFISKEEQEELLEEFKAEFAALD